MMFAFLGSRSRKRQKASKAARPTRSFKPRLEPLEDRTLLAVVVWSGNPNTFAGTWAQKFGKNWVGNKAPLKTDTASFNQSVSKPTLSENVQVANLDVRGGKSDSGNNAWVTCPPRRNCGAGWARNRCRKSPLKAARGSKAPPASG